MKEQLEEIINNLQKHRAICLSKAEKEKDERFKAHYMDLVYICEEHIAEFKEVYRNITYDS